SPNERDLSIRCVQAAVSESDTTRAARSRECTASTQRGGAHARDSSITRGTRLFAVRNSTQIGAIDLKDASLIDAALFSHSRRQLLANAVIAASRVGP